MRKLSKFVAGVAVPSLFVAQIAEGQPAPSLQTRVTDLEAAVSSQQTQIHALQGTVSTLQEQVASLQRQVTALQNNPTLALAPFVSVDPNPVNGLQGPHLFITGVNIHVRSGSGSTDDSGPGLTGLGNLIIGYNELPPPNKLGEIIIETFRRGAHNLIVGPGHGYSSYGGLVAGSSNSTASPSSTVSGGSDNTASGWYSSVSGGLRNTASGQHSSVSGGQQNSASGNVCSVSAGLANTASGLVCGVSGGQNNIASGIASSVTGGELNIAGGDRSSISGGRLHEATGEFDWQAGSLFQDQ
jgi:uncharacterized coiled-coil protein SlyX